MDVRSRLDAATCLTILIILVGCQGSRSTTLASNHDVLRSFRSMLVEKRFNEAFVFYDRVAVEMADVAEGALGHEYDQMISRTAANGQDDWNAILINPEIPLSRKVDLVHDIHLNASYEAKASQRIEETLSAD